MMATWHVGEIRRSGELAKNLLANFKRPSATASAKLDGANFSFQWYVNPANINELSAYLKGTGVR